MPWEEAIFLLKRKLVITKLSKQKHKNDTSIHEWHISHSCNDMCDSSVDICHSCNDICHSSVDMCHSSVDMCHSSVDMLSLM
jgi:hypothetical protein